MSRRTSKRLWLAVGVVAAVAAAVLALPYLLSVERYKARVVERVEEALGREATLGALRVHLLPSLHVELADLRVKNPPGFPEGDTATVESVAIGLAAWPLLERRVVVDSLEVEGVELRLLSDERGRTNYEFETGRVSAADGDGEPGAGVSLARIGSVAVQDVRVSSGRFRSRSKAVDLAWGVRGINLTLSNLNFEEADWLGEVEAEMDLSTVEVSVPALQEALRFTDGMIRVTGNRAQGDFVAALGSLRAEGSLTVADLRRRVADFTVRMRALNVAELSRMAAERRERERVAGGRRPAGRALLARGTVRVGRVIVPPYSAQNVQGRVQLYENRLVVDPFVLDVYGGKTRGDLLIDLDTPSVPARVNLNAKEVDVSRALAAADPEAADTITGVFETEGQLTLPLGTRDPLAGLAGEGTFAVRDGTFPGLNVEGTLVGMAKLMQMDVPAGDTEFSYFGGDYRIADQRVHSRKLELRSEQLEADLSGSFGFDQTINYHGSGLLKGGGGDPQEQQQSSNPFSALGKVFGKVVQGSMNFTRMRVPFAVRGTFQERKIIVTGPPTPLR